MCRLQIAALDTDARWVRSLDGSEYMPGLVGLNNMKANDYVNVIVQVRSALHVSFVYAHQTGASHDFSREFECIDMSLIEEL